MFWTRRDCILSDAGKKHKPFSMIINFVVMAILASLSFLQTKKKIKKNSTNLERISESRKKSNEKAE